MKVRDLVKVLGAYPQDLDVVYGHYSEQLLLEVGDIKTGEFCFPRLDGWVQDKRDDKPFQEYLVLPGD